MTKMQGHGRKEKKDKKRRVRKEKDMVYIYLFMCYIDRVICIKGFCSCGPSSCYAYAFMYRVWSDPWILEIKEQFFAWSCEISSTEKNENKNEGEGEGEREGTSAQLCFRAHHECSCHEPLSFSLVSFFSFSVSVCISILFVLFYSGD